MMEKVIKITKHAQERGAQRFGWPEQQTLDKATAAFRKGLPTKAIKNEYLKDYMANKARKYSATIKFYQNALFIYKQTREIEKRKQVVKLVTVYSIEEDVKLCLQANENML